MILKAALRFFYFVIDLNQVQMLSFRSTVNNSKDLQVRSVNILIPEADPF